MSEAAKKSMAKDDRAAQVAALYARAFAEYGTRALWSLRQLEQPTLEDALAITRSLRVEGDMGGRRLAEEIERLAGADQQDTVGRARRHRPVPRS